MEWVNAIHDCIRKSHCVMIIKAWDPMVLHPLSFGLRRSLVSASKTQR